MKKITTLLLLLAMVFGLFSGCGSSIDNSGYIPTGDAIIGEDEEPPEETVDEDSQELILAYYPNRSLNPLFGSDYTNRVLMSLMYQGMFVVDSSKNVEPMLCSSFRVNPRQTVWTFYVDENATFSDGSRVTIEDVMASYARAKENDYYKNRFRHLLEMEITDDGGLAMYLDTPYENLPLLLDVPIVKANEVEAEHPLGTGPYFFTQDSSGSYLHRVDTWWCGDVSTPATDRTISLVEVSSPAQIRDEFQFGSLSLACTNPMSASFAEYRSDYELWSIESGYMMYIGCNITYSDFFEDGTLRTYLTYAIDRETLAESAYNGLVDTITLPCSPRVSYYSKSLAKQYEYDSLKFIDRLRSFSIPRDKEKGGYKTMRLLVNSDDSIRVEIARDIAEALTELGLPCRTMERSQGTYKDILYAGNYDIYLGMTRLSPNMDLTEFFRPYGEMRFGGLSHETLYGMVKHSLENSGNFYNLHKILADDGRIIPVMFGYYNVYTQRGVVPDLAPSRDNVFYYSIGKSMKDIQQPTEF